MIPLPSLLLVLALLVSGALGADGFITVQRIHGRWYFVDGDGAPFIQKGVVHTRIARGHWQSEHGDDWKAVVEDELKRMGFNSHGYDSFSLSSTDLKFFVLPSPQLTDLSVYHGGDFVDIFDPAVRAELENRIRSTASTYRNDPNLIGYMFTDVPDFVTGKSGSWVDYIKRLGASAPGREAYDGWRSDNPNATDDEFISVIVGEYYRFASEKFREYDPNHLIIGDNYGEWLGAQSSIIEQAAKYVDVISVQPNWSPHMELSTFWDPIYASVGKPMIISDFKIPHDIGPDDYYPDDGRDQEEAGREMLAFFDQFLSTEYMIGWSHCMFVDEEFDGGRKVKQGLYSADGTPYTTYQDHVIQVHEAMDRFVLDNTGGLESAGPRE